MCVRTGMYVCMYTCKKADDAKLTKTDDNDACKHPTCSRQVLICVVIVVMHLHPFRCDFLNKNLNLSIRSLFLSLI